MKKGLQNKRYRKTEEAIIEVLLNTREMPSTRELTRRARISRSTLYRHHKAIPGIIPDYEKEILWRFRRIVRKLLRQKDMKLKNVYLRTLFFVLRYKKVFEILFRYEGGRVVERMMEEIRDEIIKTYHLPKNSGKIIRIHAKEVAGMIEEWGKDGFKEDNLEAVLGDVVYLTETIRKRLGRLR